MLVNVETNITEDPLGGKRETIGDITIVLFWPHHGEYTTPSEEYGINGQLKLKIRQWSWDYDYESGKMVEEGHWEPELPEEYKEVAGGDWGDVIELTGSLYALREVFCELAGALDPSLDPAGYTPGGDDDFFDYWPGNMEVLSALADDLDAVANDFYRVDGRPGFRKVYFNVVEHFLQKEKRRFEPHPNFIGEWWDQEIVEEFAIEYCQYYNLTKGELNERIR